MDWNVINHIDDIPGLYDFILTNQNHFVFVYSPAHFSDLMRSLKEGEKNEYLAKDIERLEAICETHLMRYDNGVLCLYKCLPTEFFEKEGEMFEDCESVFKPSFYQKALSSIEPCLYDAFIEDLGSIDFGKEVEIPLLGRFSNALEFYDCLLSFLDGVFSDGKKSKHFKMEFTKDIPFKEINVVNNHLPKDVIGAIEELLSRYGLKDKLVDVARNSLDDNQKDNEKLLFVLIYLFLDFLRYHSDRKGLWNILSDAEHAFYGSCCDVLVTDDDRMKRKTEAVYSCFDKTTEVVHKEDLLEYLVSELSYERNLKEPIEILLSTQRVPKEYNNDIEYSKVKLEHPFLSYFNIMECQELRGTGRSYFLFGRDLSLDRFVYYTETEKLFQIIKDILCDSNAIEAFENEYVERYYSNDRTAEFGFYISENVLFSICMSENEDYVFPLLAMVYTSEKNAD